MTTGQSGRRTATHTADLNEVDLAAVADLAESIRREPAAGETVWRAAVDGGAPRSTSG
ncbi:MAG: hypothetical protein AAGA93_13225 [Actinomycetota bacterium]